jgi:hypothetical protein
MISNNNHSPIPRGPVAVRIMGAFCLTVVLLLCITVAAQEQPSTGAKGPDTIQTKSDGKAMDSIRLAPEAKVMDSSGSAPQKAAVDTTRPAPEKKSMSTSGLVNIALNNKKIRAYGWGEYRVGGRCLCCDKPNDGDCIIVHTIERTNRERINQIFDGKIEGDTSDKTSYFGDLRKRDLPEPASLLMAEITLGKAQEIRKVIVYTMIDNEKHANFLSNCELGYNDQFGRMQWSGKVESKKYDAPIAFEFEKPALTKMLQLRVEGGKNRITEVEIFAEDKKE